MQSLQWPSHKSSSRAGSYSERCRARQSIPNYRILVFLATLFNPPLGVVVYFLNRAAVRSVRDGSQKRAERLYLATIVLSVSSIVVTLTAIAEVVIWVQLTPDLQEEPCVVTDAMAERARQANKSLPELCKSWKRMKTDSLAYNQELEQRKLG